jgi:hypothetical protein
MSWFGNNQLFCLLGPSDSGKTELLLAIQDLKEIGERTKRKIAADHDNPKFAKAEAEAHHSTKTTLGRMPLCKIRISHASRFISDCSGLENGQGRWIKETIDYVKPKPSKWKNGVLGIMVFNICDILNGKEAIIKDVESTYRDFLETYGREIHGIADDEPDPSPEELMRGKKKQKKEQFRPPLGIIFVGSHRDCVSAEQLAEAEKRVRNMIASIENAAQHCLELPSTMKFPTSHTVIADLYHLEGRLAFEKDFLQELDVVTKLMKASINS